jgi:hypothetical protein
MRKIALIVLVMALSVVAVHAQEDGGGDPIIPQFPLLRSGEAVSGTLEGDVTAQLFAFNAAAEDTVTVNMMMDAGSDVFPFIVLLGPAGQAVATSAQGAITTDIPIPGTYFVIATTSEAIDGRIVQEYEQPQPYTLSVSGNNPPPAANGRYAFFLTPVETGELFEEGYSSPSEPVYYFAYEGSEGETITVTMVAQEASLDPMLFLFDAEGDRLAVNDDAETLQLPDPADAALEDVRLPQSGLYFIFATDAFFYEIPNETEDTENPYEGGDFELLIE